MSELDARPGRSDEDAPAASTTASAFDRLDHLGATSEAPAPAAPTLTRRGRLRKWDRPPPPKDWRWWVGNLGKTLIATGLLMFAFVAYQLWGTGIETARAQNQLENEFDALLAEAPPIATPTPDVDPTTPAAPTTESGSGDAVPEGDGTTGDTDAADDPALAPTEPTVTSPPVPIEEQNIPALEDGDALARLEIPRIGRNDIVVAGVQTGDLKRGPGHFPDTPLPGQLGNAAIAGHRTTYGSPFFNVDKLDVGDEIIATTLNGRFTYRVTGQQIVSSSDYWVVATADPNLPTLTLISCHPKYTARERIVVFSELVASESAPVGEPVLNYGRADDEPIEDEPTVGDAADDVTVADDDPTIAAPDSAPSDGAVTGNVGEVVVVDEPETLTSGQVSDEIVDAFSDGWFSDPGANLQVGLWGTLLALLGVGAYLISRRLRRDWAGAMIGLVPFVVTLYFFFQNVNRLLPPNL